ncbi:DUF2878 domain-containing protein [Marinospirillum perlucidum]|uniref:DUF2878 domain-containing protein n=1 Tax=Marinospirillum perlucidum TaxID=1982602 RepID=UPI001C499F74|nr:DUF2878 domain-containing protein [Marinospirillum perlucidum]
MIKSRLQQLLANLVLFQLGWFACVLGGMSAWLVLPMCFVALHLLWLAEPGEALFLILVAALGGLVDSLWMQAGWMEFPGWSAPWLPGWLLILWLLFATTLKHSLAWLQGRWWLAALLGALGGSSSYYAGALLGAAEFPRSLPTTLMLLALAWAVIFPGLLWLAQQRCLFGDRKA